jgi:hypothetical protein
MQSLDPPNARKTHRRIVVPPEGENVPSETTKMGGLPSVPGTIRRDLRDPPRAVVAWNRSVGFTSMPKATMNENHDSTPRQDYVGTTRKIGPVLFDEVTTATQQGRDIFFRTSSGRALGLHSFRSRGIERGSGCRTFRPIVHFGLAGRDPIV